MRRFAVQVFFVFHFHHMRTQHAVDFHHGNSSVHAALFLADGRTDGRHLGRTRCDKEYAHVLRLAVVLFTKFRARNVRSKLHGLTDIADIGDQIGETHLNQAHDRRTGGGDQRAGQIGIPQLFMNGAADNIRCARDLKHIVKADLFQCRKHIADVLEIAELRIQAGRRQRNAVLIILDRRQRIGLHNLCMVAALANALAAINAALVNNMRAAVMHADGLGRAVHQTIGAALAQVFIQSYGMKPFHFAHGCISFPIRQA